VDLFHGPKASAGVWCMDDGTPVLTLDLCPVHVRMVSDSSGSQLGVDDLRFAKELFEAVKSYVFELERALYVTERPEAF
jgi:hypothetical protein